MLRLLMLHLLKAWKGLPASLLPVLAGCRQHMHVMTPAWPRSRQDANNDLYIERR